MAEAWTSPISPADPMFYLYQRLRSAKFCCKSLNRSSFSNIQNRTKEAFQHLEEIQRRVLTTQNQAVFEEENAARLLWIRLAAAEESFFHQKSRVRWLKEGDSNTGYFHKAVTANLARNVIHYLRNEEDVKVSDSSLLKSMVSGFI
ncbi:unnamed protein product [Microthlaspi erraticum]|uniref:Uncharacterized protein n=1 Tax=Microthlaspi erraticum TaxID=1685480 RepID=A0A6D2IF10_9BRAS|nr:unnamed protein product [Microthlaspi erraticum]